MDIKRCIFFIFLCYFLILLQASFLPHFSVFGFVPNLSLILVFFINLFEKKNNLYGIVCAFFSGLLADIYSEYFFGFYAIIFLLLAILTKLLIKGYVRVPFAKRD